MVMGYEDFVGKGWMGQIGLMSWMGWIGWMSEIGWMAQMDLGSLMNLTW